MAIGTVKWFNNAKGWGFIVMENGYEAFVHYSDVKGDGFKALYVGDSVEFEVDESPRGTKAIDVRKCEKKPEASRSANSESKTDISEE